MTEKPQDDPVLARFRAALAEIYGPRLIPTALDADSSPPSRHARRRPGIHDFAGSPYVSISALGISRVVLFGSRARGDARPDSDYDVAVFLAPLGDRWQELDRLAALRLQFLDEAEVFLDAIPYDASAYRDRSPLMHEIRHEGLDV